MEINTIQMILSALGGGVLSVFLTYIINSRKQGVSEFELIIQERKEIADGLEIRLVTLEKEIQSLRLREIEQREEIVELKHQIIILKLKYPDDFGMDLKVKSSD